MTNGLVTGRFPRRFPSNIIIVLFHRSELHIRSYGPSIVNLDLSALILREWIQQYMSSNETLSGQSCWMWK